MMVLRARFPHPKSGFIRIVRLNLIRRFFSTYRVRLGRPNPLKDIRLGSRVPDPLPIKGPCLDSISFNIPLVTQTGRWNTLVGGIKLPVCKSLVSLEGLVGVKLYSKESVSHEAEEKSKPKSKAPPVTQRDGSAARKFKTASKPVPPASSFWIATDLDATKPCNSCPRTKYLVI
jgi:hypothetical protein